MNAGQNPIVIPKGFILTKFSPVTEEFQVPTVNSVNNVNIVQNVDVFKQANFDQIGHKASEVDEFMNNFKTHTNLNDEQKCALDSLLYQNKDVFVTPDNPDLGLTDLVEHHIIMKPNFKPLHQKPYRLTPHKREVLRHHLSELLRQGVICELDPKEDAPISSPIVLVAKRTKPTSSPSSDQVNSLRQYRFCVDFRYLNAQTETFKYTIPNLQELTESFSERVPNYIASIDMSSGFFSNFAKQFKVYRVQHVLWNIQMFACTHGSAHVTKQFSNAHGQNFARFNF